MRRRDDPVCSAIDCARLESSRICCHNKYDELEDSGLIFINNRPSALITSAAKLNDNTWNKSVLRVESTFWKA